MPNLTRIFRASVNGEQPTTTAAVAPSPRVVRIVHASLAHGEPDKTLWEPNGILENLDHILR